MHLPASAFLAPSKEKRLSSEAAGQKQLLCRWSKVSSISLLRSPQKPTLLRAAGSVLFPSNPRPRSPLLQCNQLFDLLQDLVDHVNDFHVKPEKDAGYCCHWEGCARHGRGFNAR